MHVLHVGASATKGGASIAMYRLHKALSQAGVTSSVMVQQKTVNDPNVLTVSQLNGRVGSLLLRWSAWREKQQVDGIRKDPHEVWSFNNTPNGLAHAINRHPSDIAHLHWGGGGFMPIQAIFAVRKPLVWTMHDMWGITGGCHYAGDCRGFTQRCGMCPLLVKPSENDFSAQLFAQKHKHWAQATFQTVTPSRWLADAAQQSALLATQPPPVVIPNTLDVQQFKPLDKRHSRRALNLPEDGKLVLFGAVDLNSPYKGYVYLQESLHKLAQQHQDIAFVSFGGGKQASEALGVPVYHLGVLHDEVSLTLAYSAADVFIAPSTQDNLPNTVMEALACGTPAIAFSIGGMPDLIQHQQRGYLAEPFDTDALAHGIDWVLSHNQPGVLGEQARAHVLANYTYDKVAARYIALYEQVLERYASRRL